MKTNKIATEIAGLIYENNYGMEEVIAALEVVKMEMLKGYMKACEEMAKG